MAQDKKRDAIIQAAKKRFSHFGVAKTTMNEIADDLSISKASLYYYFPDKLNLYAAVLQAIIQAEEEHEPALMKEKNLLKAINKFLEIRTEFIIKNYNVLEYLRTIGTSIPLELETLFTSAKTREIYFISTLLTNAEEQGQKIKDPKKIAELLFDCLEGLRHTALNSKLNFFPDKEQFHEILKREKAFAAIFIKGLTC